jgi:hypothetical protein
LGHAISDYTAFFGGGCNDGAAGAHTKTVDTAAIFAVMDKFVFRGTQCRMSRLVAEACAIDRGLWVFNTKADRKGFGFNIDAMIE